MSAPDHVYSVYIKADARPRLAGDHRRRRDRALLLRHPRRLRLVEGRPDRLRLPGRLGRGRRRGPRDRPRPARDDVLPRPLGPGGRGRGPGPDDLGGRAAGRRRLEADRVTSGLVAGTKIAEEFAGGIVYIVSGLKTLRRDGRPDDGPGRGRLRGLGSAITSGMNGEAGPASADPAFVPFLGLHDPDDVPLGIGEECDRRLGRDLGQRHDHLAAARRDLVERRPAVVGVDVERDVARRRRPGPRRSRRSARRPGGTCRSRRGCSCRGSSRRCRCRTSGASAPSLPRDLDVNDLGSHREPPRWPVRRTIRSAFTQTTNGPAAELTATGPRAAPLRDR